MNRIKINDLEFLQWDVHDDNMQELIDWLNIHAKKVPIPDMNTIEDDIESVIEEEWSDEEELDGNQLFEDPIF